MLPRSSAVRNTIFTAIRAATAATLPHAPACFTSTNRQQRDCCARLALTRTNAQREGFSRGSSCSTGTVSLSVFISGPPSQQLCFCGWGQGGVTTVCPTETGFLGPGYCQPLCQGSEPELRLACSPHVSNLSTLCLENRLWPRSRCSLRGRAVLGSLQ